MLPEEIAARVWPGRELVLEPLGGGITNHNFKVIAHGEPFVLRIGGKDTALLGIDRDAEHAATRIAAELGVGPEVIAFVEPGGYLVTRFVEGRPLAVEEVRLPERLRSIAGILRRVHEGPPFPARFDSFRVVESYVATARACGVTPPSAHDRAKAIAERIEHARGAQQAVPCHNDLLNANFIAAGDEVRLVDWEYAGMGDRFFDLANFSINHELDDSENEELLASYFGELDPDDLRALRLMRFMSDFREAMWGVVQQGVSELDFDFVGYTQEHFERLERTASDPGFQAALAG
ncbi:MAG: choline/ethanolamine kinase family protein [Actinomycetota bacterium]